MSDNQALNEQLRRLSSDVGRVVEGKRVILEPGHGGAIEAVRIEIDSTILSRELTFVSGSSSITVIASGRRLTKLVSTSADIAFPAKYLNTILGSEDLAGPVAVKSAFAALDTSAAPLLVESVPHTREDEGVKTGVSASQLTEYWGVETVVPSVMDPFLAAIAETSDAHILLEQGTITRSAGDESAIALLSEAARVQLPALVASSQNAPQLICFQDAAQNGVSLAAAITPEANVILSYDNTATGAIMTAWQNNKPS
ncbi:MAG: hypothetical protein ABJ327_15970 [Litoreibacter sp.]